MSEAGFLEEERQLMLMALANLSVQRPDWWRPALAGIAAKLRGEDLFEYFIQLTQREAAQEEGGWTVDT